MIYSELRVRVGLHKSNKSPHLSRMNLSQVSSAHTYTSWELTTSLTTGVDYQISTSAAHQPTVVKSEPQESLEIPCKITHLLSF